MHKKAPTIEWQIAESDAEWERLHASLLDSAPGPHRRLRLQHCLWSGMVLLLLACAGGWVWRTEQVKAHQAAAEATVAAQQALGAIAPLALPQPVAEVTARPQWEIRAFAPNAHPSAASLTGDQATTDAWRAFRREASGLQTVEIQGDQAVARVVMRTKNGTPGYRQTRFYRRTPTAWVQIAPDAALWGPERSLETPYFVYHFRQNDAPIVVAVASQVDALYTTMRSNFGLSITPDTAPLVIQVSVTQLPGHASPGFARVTRFLVPSPALYLAPVERTDAELLEQSIALPLLNYVLAQARQRHAIGSAWQSMLSGLRLWQLWHLNLPLAERHEEFVKWIYRDLPAASHRQQVVLPAHYEELCATYQLWMPSLTLLDLPLVCSERDRDVSFFSILGRRDPLTRLDQLALPAPPYEQGTYMSNLLQLQLPTRSVALAALIDYAVATYGRERLPLFVAGLGHYDTWETLIPGVYGVSATEFEAGWQAYLKAHYGIISAN